MRIHQAAFSSTATLMSSPREARLAQENRRMRQNFDSLVAADHRVVDFGPDPFVQQLLLAHGFDPREAFAKRIFVASNGDDDTARPMTAVVVAGRVWHQAWERYALRAVIQQAAEERTRCIVVPQRTISGPGRLATARFISLSRHVPCTASDRMRILAHIDAEGGYSCLGDCAMQLPHHPDPVGAVLALVSRGDLRIDRRRNISAHSRIDVC